MLIALDDPLWTRLYGADGVPDVTGSLEALSRCWDEAEARELSGHGCKVRTTSIP